MNKIIVEEWESKTDSSYDYGTIIKVGSKVIHCDYINGDVLREILVEINALYEVEYIEPETNI